MATLEFMVFDEIAAGVVAAQADQRPRRGPALVNAHLIGRDDVMLRGDVTLRDGRIRCRKRTSDPAALCLQVDAGPMGRLMLQTCLLPEREAPYLLALELARQRIKQFIAKSEEWQLFDLPPEHAAIKLWESAREHFTAAITDPDTMSAERSARASLIAGIEASERLAMAHAEILLHRRFGARAASATTLGVGVWPGRFDAANQANQVLLAREADIIVVPLAWRDLEVAEGRYDWERTDRWMSWAHSQGKPIVAGPLLDFSPRATPPWATVFANDFDTLRDLVYDHLAKVVERYRGVVGIWNLGAGINLNDHFTLTTDQMIALVRTASVLVRQMRKGARTMIELTQPFGEHAAFNRDSLAPMAWLDRLVQEGLQLDCIGVRVQFGRAADGLAARDVMQVSAMLDRLLPFETPVMITGLGVPAETVDPRGGHWHAPWSPKVQADWIGQIVPVALSKPFVEAIFWGDLADHPGMNVPRSGLLTEGGEPRPGLTRLVTLRRRLRKPLGQLKVAQRATVLGEEFS